MKKVYFIIGVIVGVMLFGGISIASSYITVRLSEQPIYVDGERVDMLAYLINGNNFVRLRDIGSAVDFAVDWDEETGSVHINSNNSYVSETESSESSQMLASRIPIQPVEFIRFTSETNDAGETVAMVFFFEYERVIRNWAINPNLKDYFINMERGTKLYYEMNSRGEIDLIWKERPGIND